MTNNEQLMLNILKKVPSSLIILPKKLKNKIDTETMPNPSFMMVLTATGNYAYKKEDGVFVVPIGCLKD